MEYNQNPVWGDGCPKERAKTKLTKHFRESNNVEGMKQMQLGSRSSEIHTISNLDICLIHIGITLTQPEYSVIIPMKKAKSATALIYLLPPMCPTSQASLICHLLFFVSLGEVAKSLLSIMAQGHACTRTTCQLNIHKEKKYIERNLLHCYKFVVQRYTWYPMTLVRQESIEGFEVWGYEVEDL